MYASVSIHGMVAVTADTQWCLCLKFEAKDDQSLTVRLYDDNALTNLIIALKAAIEAEKEREELRAQEVHAKAEQVFGLESKPSDRGR